MILFVTPDTDGTSAILRELDNDIRSEHLADPEPHVGDVIRFIENHEVDTVVVGPELDGRTTEQLIGGITDLFPFVGVLAFVDDEPDSMRSAFRLGASDVVGFDADDTEVAKVLSDIRERMETRRTRGGIGVADAAPQRRVITTLSPRGGVGRTVIAAGLAATLERRTPGDVVIVDLDLQAGDIAPLLGLTPRLSLGSLVGREADMDSADVKAVLATDEIGLHVLAAPPTLSSAVEVTPALITALLKLLSASFQYVVIDTGPYLSEPTLAAIDGSTDLLLVCAPDVPSVRAIGRANDALDQLGVIAPRRHLVLNRATDRYGMPPRDIESVTGMDATTQIRSSKEMAVALNQGNSVHQLLQPRAVLSKAMTSLVESVAPRSETPTRRRMLRRAG